MKVVVKVGTQSILSNDGVPLEPVLLNLVGQIAALQESGHQVVLVSSGAVGFGRSVARKMLMREYGATIGEKQVLASLGQPELMRVYVGMFEQHNMLACQLLLTKQDFHTRQHYLNISRLFCTILAQKNMIPIVNENDSVAIEELMFTDNDELAGLIAAQIDAEKLIILSNVEGVYTGHPASQTSELITMIDPKDGWPKISSAKSLHGRGGMISKLVTARKMSGLGITTHIASISQPAVLTRLVGGDAVGTLILPAKKQSSLKRWIGYNTTQASGTIWINHCLYEILKENKRVMSILPVGIEQCSGAFQKGDVVEIMAAKHGKIGVGLARYDVKKLSELCGQKNKPAFMHYDYLHIF